MGNFGSFMHPSYPAWAMKMRFNFLLPQSLALLGAGP